MSNRSPSARDCSSASHRTAVMWHGRQSGHVPLFVRLWSISAGAICKMPTKSIDPNADRFPANYYAPRGQKVFNISRAQS